MEVGVKEQLASLPARPGVYVFRDAAGEVLYIGKAKTLRSRVRSYFQKTTDGRVQIRQLPERVADIEVIVTGSEVEALHLEQNLVKRHRPPFNVRLRDDKSFPYIAVTVEDEFPRVMFTRERHRPGVWYFGPYANAKKVRETLDVLNRVFPYRPCEGPKPGRHSGIPCLDYHIDRCLAPCVGYVSAGEYRAIVDGVIEFLSGETRPIQRELEQKMHAAAREERYEDAARYRNRLFAVQHLVERQAVERQSVGTADVIGFAADGDRAVVQIFPLRGGKMVDRYSFHVENVGGQDVTTVLESFGLEYYGSAPSVPPQIVVPRDAGDLSALAELLSERRGSKVVVRSAERGEKRRLQQLADENALHALRTDVAQGEQRRLRRVEALEELREVLNLESLPLRVECYDISHAMGQDPVGSMVVFQDAQPRKADYRKFGIKSAGADPDDFAAMAEVISRRFARLSDGTVAGSISGRAADARPADRAATGGAGSPYDASFAAAPNLVVIDGGKGQLSAALAAIQAYDLPRVAVIALAKRDEEVFVPGRSDPIVLDRHSPGLQLLQRIRDEAHRFALGFHRQRREQRGFGSIFDGLEGVGPMRRRALLQHFGSVETMLAAAPEELEGVPGLPAKTARRIYAQLHKTGGAQAPR
ncbi:MAG TPA: excinuclease ABC subunit UvrC [Gaiellaceae bacterium]|nr:excinuclease ABC subunit UvrC [Gaiellaceae bacterium]